MMGRFFLNTWGKKKKSGAVEEVAQIGIKGGIDKHASSKGNIEIAISLALSGKKSAGRNQSEH